MRAILSTLSLLASAVAMTLLQNHPVCIESIIPVSAEATNYNLSDGTLPPTATSPVSGTFDIQLRLCAPSILRHSDTLQVLVHGATYGLEYFDISFQPEKYNYVRYAASQGYYTLNMARLGYGNSDRPDPTSVVQDAMGIAVIAEVIKLARSGGIPGAPLGFRKIAFVGHSFGSIILNGLLVVAPSLVDAAIFTSYSHEPNVDIDLVALSGLGPARNISPARFGQLPEGYLTSKNATTRSSAFYGPSGTYDPDALEWDESHKDTFTLGEALTQGTTIVSALAFQGDVLTVNGDHDLVFHPQNTSTEWRFYPAAQSVEYAIIADTGHSLNYQNSAPVLYEIVHEWLVRHSY